MQNLAGQQKNWWAEGDTPVRHDSRVTYFTDGRAAMLIMCHHFIKAQRYIYLGNWGMTAKMELVRGTDHRLVPMVARSKRRCWPNCGQSAFKMPTLISGKHMISRSRPCLAMP